MRLVRVVGRCKWPRCNSVSSTMGKTRKTKKIGLKKILAKTDMRLKANQEAAAEEKKKKGAVRNLYVARDWLWRWAMFRMHTRTPRAAALPCQAEALSKPLLRVQHTTGPALPRVGGHQLHQLRHQEQAGPGAGHDGLPPRKVCVRAPPPPLLPPELPDPTRYQCGPMEN